MPGISRRQLCVPPEPFDSYAGYLIRIAYVYGYPKMQWVRGLLVKGQTRHFDHAPEAATLQRLSRLTRQPVAMLCRLSAHGFAQVLQAGGQTDLEKVTRQRFLQKASQGYRFCPRCLGEGIFHHRLWQLRPVTACLTHGLLLLDRCSGCQAPIQPDNLLHDRCRCGARLTALEASSLPHDSDGAKAQRAIQAWLSGAGGQPGWTAPAYFQTLELMRRWLSAFPPGVLQADGVTTAAQPVLSPASRRKWEAVLIDHVHYTLSAWVLTGGGEAFSALCDLWLAHGAAEGRFAAGLRRDFRYLDALLRAEPGLSTVNQWFAAYLARRWQRTTLSRSPHRDERWVSAMTARQVLHCPPLDVVQLVTNGVLPGRHLPISNAGQVRVMVEKTGLEDAVRRREEALPLAAAAERADLPPEVLAALHLLRQLRAERGPMADGSPAIRIHPGEILRLVQRMGSPRHEWAEGMNALSLRDPFLVAERIAAVLDAPCGDRAASACPPASRLGGGAACAQAGHTLREAADGTGVGLDTLRKLAEAGLVRISGGRVENLQAFLDAYQWDYQAAAELGVKIATVRRWCAIGRLRSPFAVGSCRLVARSDVRRFVPAACAGSRDAMALLGLRHNTDLRRKYLATGRLRAIAGPGIDGGADFLFRREDVRKLTESLRWQGGQKDTY